MDVIRRFTDNDLVDVTIRAAAVSYQSDHHICLYLDGADDPLIIPIADDEGQPLAGVDVDHAVPRVESGEVWRSRGGLLFLATEHDGQVLLVGSDHKAATVAEVVATVGPIERIAAEDFPVPAGPDPDAVLVPADKVQMGDSLHRPEGWHTVTGVQNPALDHGGHVRIFTSGSPLTGLLYACDDEVWVLPGRVDAPVYELAARLQTDPASQELRGWLDVTRPTPPPAAPPTPPPAISDTVVMAAITDDREAPR